MKCIFRTLGAVLLIANIAVLFTSAGQAQLATPNQVDGGNRVAPTLNQSRNQRLQPAIPGQNLPTPTPIRQFPQAQSPDFNPSAANGNNRRPFRSPNQRQPVTLTLKLYNVDDITALAANRPFNGFALPGLGAGNQPGQTQFQLPGYGGGFGGGGAFGGGGGIFAVQSGAPQNGSGLTVQQYQNGGQIGISAETIMNAIYDFVGEQNWDETAGGGNIFLIGNVLAVQQTAEVHVKIESFLQGLRLTLKPKSSVTIKAIWLTLNEEQFQSLDIEKDQQVNSKVLTELVNQGHGKRAQVTCFDRQATHIAAGNLKSTVESMIPVVGQLEPNNGLDTQLASSNDAAIFDVVNRSSSALVAQDGKTGLVHPNATVGYQPVSRWVNFGAVLGVTPTVDPDKKMLTLDVTNILVTQTDPNASTQPGNFFLPLDRHDLNCQQFCSRVRLKDATPTMVGGSAFLDTENGLQTYLVLEAIVNTD